MTLKLSPIQPDPFDPFYQDNNPVSRRFCRHLIPLRTCTQLGCLREYAELSGPSIPVGSPSTLGGPVPPPPSPPQPPTNPTTSVPLWTGRLHSANLVTPLWLPRFTDYYPPPNPTGLNLYGLYRQFNRGDTLCAYAGNIRLLGTAFPWAYNPVNRRYWSKINHGTIPPDSVTAWYLACFLLTEPGTSYTPTNLPRSPFQP